MDLREARRQEGLARQQFLALVLARYFGDGIKANEVDAAAMRWASAVERVQQLERSAVRPTERVSEVL